MINNAGDFHDLEQYSYCLSFDLLSSIILFTRYIFLITFVLVIQ